MSAPVVIVAAAIVSDDRLRVLAAQRSYPPTLAGQWELPGGKVHWGESDLDALVRECREELGVEIEPEERLGDDVVIASSMVLRVWWARLVGGEPQPLEHDALRWLGRDQLDEVTWLAADAPVVAALRDSWQGRLGR